MCIDLKCRFCGKEFSHAFSGDNFEVEKCPNCGTIIGLNDNFVIRSVAEPFLHNVAKTECVEICDVRMAEED